MRRMRKLMLRGLFLVLFALSGFAICSGQAINASTVVPSLPSVQDSELLKLLEITKIQRDGFEQKAKLLEDRLAVKDEIIAAKDGTLAVKDEQLELLRTANKERATVNTGDARMLEQANGIIAKQDAEISKLRNPGWIASFLDRRTFGGIGLGYIGCKLTTGSNPSIQIPNPFGGNALNFQSPEERAQKAMRLFTK